MNEQTQSLNCFPGKMFDVLEEKIFPENIFNSFPGTKRKFAIPGK